MKSKEVPRLLVLSNNGFSKQNSNGRTLGSLLQGWPNDRIAQFCISSDGPDFDVCENYYCVTDSDVLRSILHLKPSKRRILEKETKIDANATPNGQVRHFKNSLNMLLRNLAWQVGLWRGKEFNRWIDRFAPDIILLQNGESFFMHSLAMKIAKRTGAQIAMFNTEPPYLAKTDYFRYDNRFLRKVLFPIYHYIYRRTYEKFMRKCRLVVYGNQQLLDDYTAVFPDSKDISHVIYTGSDIEFRPPRFNDEDLKFTYAGNLGFDRPSALIELAKEINAINAAYKLDLYGPVKDEAMKQRLDSCPYINYHGMVSYSELVTIIENSHFLIHAESQDQKWQDGLKYGFSTKIADSICSGKIFLLYASSKIACARYIQSNGAGIFSENPRELRDMLIKAISTPACRDAIIEKARKVAAENHSKEKNKAKIMGLLVNTLKN